MATVECPNCGHTFAIGGRPPTPIPPEPPIGTWVKDRFGGVSLRYKEGWGEPGFWPVGIWEAMWEARGPLVECPPWGREP